MGLEPEVEAGPGRRAGMALPAPSLRRRRGAVRRPARPRAPLPGPLPDLRTGVEAVSAALGLGPGRVRQVVGAARRLHGPEAGSPGSAPRRDRAHSGKNAATAP